MSNVSQQGQTGGRPPSAVINTNNPATLGVASLGAPFTDTTITGTTVNNYEGDAAASLWLIPGSSVPVTSISGIGLVGGNTPGCVLYIVNNGSAGGSKELEFTNLDAGSLAANQFYLPGLSTLSLVQGEGAVFVYGTREVAFSAPQPCWLLAAVNQA